MCIQPILLPISGPKGRHTIISRTRRTTSPCVVTQFSAHQRRTGCRVSLLMPHACHRSDCGRGHMLSRRELPFCRPQRGWNGETLLEDANHRLPQQLSARGWCAEHKISTKTYYRWEKEILSSAAGELVPAVSAPQPPATFVELPSLPEQQTVGGVVASIQIGKGKAYIYSGAEAVVVRAICQVLKSC